MVQKGPIWSKTLGSIILVPFGPFLDHFGTLTGLPCSAIFGPKWTIFGPSPVINGGPQKRLITRSSMCGLLVKPQHIRFGTQIWQQSMKNVKNRSEIYEKMAVFCHHVAMNCKLWIRRKFFCAYLVLICPGFCTSGW